MNCIIISQVVMCLQQDLPCFDSLLCLFFPSKSTPTNFILAICYTQTLNHQLRLRPDFTTLSQRCFQWHHIMWARHSTGPVYYLKGNFVSTRPSFFLVSTLPMIKISVFQHFFFNKITIFLPKLSLVNF